MQFGDVGEIDNSPVLISKKKTLQNKQMNQHHHLLFISFIIATISIVFVFGQQPPVWPSQFQQSYNETVKIGFLTGKTSGKYYYDAINNYTRIDRENGEYDRYCGSVHYFTNTPCTHLVRDGKRYLIFPELNNCCLCCNQAHGCGILKRDWLSNATFIGYEEYNGVKVGKWNKPGLQNNYYAATADSRQVPVYIDQVPNDFMAFNVESYQEKITDPSVFDLPSICSSQQSCPLISICTIAN
jgi:hypothetical protein